MTLGSGVRSLCWVVGRDGSGLTASCQALETVSDIMVSDVQRENWSRPGPRPAIGYATDRPLSKSVPGRGVDVMMDCCGCIGKLERCQQLGSAPSRERVRVTAILFKLHTATLLGCVQLESNRLETGLQRLVA